MAQRLLLRLPLRIRRLQRLLPALRRLPLRLPLLLRRLWLLHRLRLLLLQLLHRHHHRRLRYG
jgi:hypothetical protein